MKIAQTMASGDDGGLEKHVVDLFNGLARTLPLLRAKSVVTIPNIKSNLNFTQGIDLTLGVSQGAINTLPDGSRSTVIYDGINLQPQPTALGSLAEGLVPPDDIRGFARRIWGFLQSPPKNIRVPPELYLQSQADSTLKVFKDLLLTISPARASLL